MAFIPARGGSKGIPRKNLVLLRDKPLIQYTLEAAQASRHVTDIFVSSDDQEIIEFCETKGLSVPYRRPPELASDESPTIDAVVHAIKWMQRNRNAVPDIIVLLQPTSPLRQTVHIDAALELFFKREAESLVSVHEMGEHPYECARMTSSAWEFLAKPSRKVTRRQDYSELFYYLNGAIYIATTNMLLRERAFVQEGKTIFYEMNPLTGIDIDNLLDMKQAEFLMQCKELT